MRRGRTSSFAGIIVAAVIAVPSMAFVLKDSLDNSQPGHKLELTSATGAVSISNSQDGQAILTASPMIPGQHTTGMVELSNTGDGTESLVLDSKDPVDQPGPAGGQLSQRLLLKVEDVSQGAPVTVYDGSLTGLHLTDLGTWNKDETRTYRFVVTFPDGGANGADNAYQGSSATIGFTWTADAAGGSTAPADDAPYEQQVAYDAPLSYWPVDGSAAAMSDLSGNHDGQYSNGVTTAGGSAPGGGSAASFEGTASYGYVNSFPAPASAYSLEAWVRPESTDDGLIVDHVGAGALGIKDGHFAFRQTDTIVLAANTFTVGHWYHLVGTWDVSSGTAHLYVDGKLDGSASAPTAPSGSGTLYVGRGSWAGGASAFLHGDVAKVSYYGSALSADRIAAHWNSGSASASSDDATTPPSSNNTDGGQGSSGSGSSDGSQSTPSTTNTTPTTTTPTETKVTTTCPKVKATSKKKPAKKKPAKKKPAKKKPAKKKPAKKTTKKTSAKTSAARNCARAKNVARAKKATPKLTVASTHAKVKH